MTVTSTRLLSGEAEDGAWIERVFALAEREAPEDLTLELVEGEIVVSGAPDGNHERIVSRVNRQITR
ncbi:hypothetical protein [Streptomyces sp. ICBB 8177]|uniref:hypothetical protein n=1 Tax=Streptomyces sp. ICBB 8177 TaxID=563922 RepID=UPI000D674A39|nr:hypothetical protein [Streptomyces sp. ICBB 8177]PWI45480.1 hypothetical protein CK485_05015 [Streptomyces sp. ICBB 8177]